ncbi:KTSC domain-containing protein [Solirubrobacter sp. CPCC 204708]|uniref:KTSC domain-containing protein n=1 Tax=Solirubrobacter deserti TaxID=2282478 RepID=A0ABT4RR45_9ACTN|nr:KTSC domain-containing protein [Solirubrobacter deserti]
MRCDSSAIAAYRFDAVRGVLELLYVEGRLVYDYPCDELLFAEFELAPSKGKFVNGVLKPHAERFNWTPTPRPLGAA